MTSEEHLFLSDVHLGAFSEQKEKEIEANLISLIDYSIKKKANLYVLGDLFDYWMEYPQKKFIPNIGNQVVEKFSEYNRLVKPVIYVTGNHDNWTFGYFSEQGFDVEPSYRILDIDLKKVLIMHGDGKFGERDDFFRPAFHLLLRNPIFVKLFQKIFPPSIGLGIMKNFSNLTRKRNHINPEPLNSHAGKILKKNDLDFVLCGHDHIPRVETFTDGTYINLGTFFKHHTLVRYINNEFKLVTWQSKSKEFVPYGSNI